MITNVQFIAPEKLGNKRRTLGGVTHGSPGEGEAECFLSCGWSGVRSGWEWESSGREDVMEGGSTGKIGGIAWHLECYVNLVPWKLESLRVILVRTTVMGDLA